MPKPLFSVLETILKKHPDIFRKLLDQGHVIGNHTYNHVKGWKTKSEDYLKMLIEAQKQLIAILNCQ